MSFWSIADLVSLVMALVGTVLLFRFSFPKSIDLGGLDENSKEKQHLSIWAWVGLSLMITSIMIQAIRALQFWT